MRSWQPRRRRGRARSPASGRTPSRANPAATAYLSEDDDEWQRVSWAEAGRAVDELAHGLLALGVRKGDAFAILASTRVEWVLFDFALALVGGVTAPIYVNSSARDAAYVVEHSEAIGILCEDDEQRAKVDGVGLEHVLTFADLDELRARGREHADNDPARSRARGGGDRRARTSTRTSTRPARPGRRRPA